MGTLTVVSGPAAGQTVEVDRELTIGREDADLTISDAQISRRHATVRPVPDGIAVHDLGSSNGTFVNGARVDDATLHSSGTLQVGDTEITVDVGAPAPQRPVAPPPRYGAPPGERPSGAAALLKRPWVPILGVVVIAGIVVAIVLASGSGDDGGSAPKTHQVSGTLHGALLARTQMSITFAGEAEQKPGGKGQFEGTLTILGDPTSGRPVPMIATATERFDSGRMDLRFTGTLQCFTKDCSKRIVKGTGGPAGRTTGEFAGAKGKLTISAHADSATRGDFAIKGSIRY